MKKALIALLSVPLVSYAGDLVKCKKPPKELDNLYPPKAKEPVLMETMHHMSIAFSGIFVNAKLGKWGKAESWAETLKRNYSKIPEMVPSWKRRVRLDAMEKLVQAVKEKDISQLKRYASVVGKTCSSCHAKYMLPVKVKYHYPSFDRVKLDDPVSGKRLSVEKYMKAINTDLKLTVIFSHNGEFKPAFKAAKRFATRYKGLTQMCSSCHTNKIVEEVYFGKETEENLTKLVKFIMAKDKEGIHGSIEKIETGCYKCHNVHEVPQMLKKKFRD